MLFILQFYNRWFKIEYPMFIKQSINDEWSKYFNESLSCLQQSWVSLKYVFWFYLSLLQYHCLKCVRIWNFYGLYSPVFRLNKEICGVNLFIQSKCGKIRARKTPNTDTFMQCVFYVEDVTILAHFIPIVLLSSFELRYQKVDTKH